MPDAPLPVNFLLPVLPNDSSPANLAIAHGNLSNLWVLAAVLFAEAGAYENYNFAAMKAMTHLHCCEWFGQLSLLAHLQANL